MAALTPTGVMKFPLGNLWLVVGQVTTTADADDEWVDRTETGINDIMAAQISAVDDAPQTTPGIGLNKNSAGTAGAEGSSMGDLGIRTDKIQTIDFLIIGRGSRHPGINRRG